MNQRVLVDMDGVLANTYAQFIVLEQKRSGKLLLMEDLNGISEEESFPHFVEDINSKGFFGTTPLIEDGVEGLKYLQSKYKVVIVSSATEFPFCLNEKRAWLSQHFPFVHWKDMIFCSSKEYVDGDIMIDDHPRNLRLFKGRKILFNQPHNAKIEIVDFERVMGWKDIMNIL